MKLMHVFLVLAIVSMLLVAGCAKTAPTADDAGADGADAPAASPEAQAEEVIDDSLVAEEDDVELGELI